MGSTPSWLINKQTASVKSWVMNNTQTSSRGVQWRDEGGRVVKQTVGGSIELIECCTKWTFGTFSSFHYFLCNEVMGVDYGRGEGRVVG